MLAAIGEGQVRCYFLPLAPHHRPRLPTPLTQIGTLLTPAVSAASPQLTPLALVGASSARVRAVPRRSQRPSASHSALLSSFSGSQAVRCAAPIGYAAGPGCVRPFLCSSTAAQAKGEWSRALRLCRVLTAADDLRLCWAVLYGLSVSAAQLDLAQQSAAQLGWTDKTRALLLMQQIPSEAGRMAALAAFQRHFERAEAVLLSAQLPGRAIGLRLQRFHWSAALALALKAGTHVDCVLLARERHQQALGGAEEPLDEFVQARARHGAPDPAAAAAAEAAERGREERQKQFYVSNIRSHSHHLADVFTEDAQQQPLRSAQTQGQASARKWPAQEEKTQSTSARAMHSGTEGPSDSAALEL